MKRLLPLLALVAVLFTGCPDPRETVNFDTDPRVLRGSWNFVLSDFSSNALVNSQAVTFTPTFVSENQYIFTASVVLEGETYAVTGGVNGRDARYIRPQFTPTPNAFMTLTGKSSGKIYSAWIPGLALVNGRWVFTGDLSTVENPMTKYQRLEIIRN